MIFFLIFARFWHPSWDPFSSKIAQNTMAQLGTTTFFYHFRFLSPLWGTPWLWFPPFWIKFGMTFYWFWARFFYQIFKHFCEISSHKLLNFFSMHLAGCWLPGDCRKVVTPILSSLWSKVGLTAPGIPDLSKDEVEDCSNEGYRKLTALMVSNGECPGRSPFLTRTRLRAAPNARWIVMFFFSMNFW